MPPDPELKKHVGRRLTKKRREGRQVTMDIPERFKDGDDADEDCTAPRGSHAQLMNQSVFGMIAAAGSRVDFNARFDGQSSDEDEGDDEPKRRTSLDASRTLQSTASTAKLDKQHRRKFSDNKLLRSLTLKSKSKDSHHSDTDTSPQPIKDEEHVVEAPEVEITRTNTREPPVMSQMLEAQAQLANRPSFDIARRQEDTEIKDEMAISSESPSNLSNRLREIFDFEEPEEVIQEYPCWLMQSVLLQGYMYVTSKHICFYAYLPKKANDVVKTGYLSKRGKQNPKYNRYWFRLKGDVLSYYNDPSDLYFVSGNIDLRYGVSAQVCEKEKGKDATYFDIVTHQRKFHLRADSAPSAKEWVKSLQKIIFRSHNDGDSVKISLPIANVVDVEDSQVVDFAETCKIRVIDNDETYAVDDYFFSFFGFGKEAISVLKILVAHNTAHNIPEELLILPGTKNGTPSSRQGSSKGSSKGSSSRGSKPPPPPIKTSTFPVHLDSVRATLSPLLSPTTAGGSPSASAEFGRSSIDGIRRSVDFTGSGRISGELSRTSMDYPRRPATMNTMGESRRSLSRGRLNGKRTSERRLSEVQDSSDSFVHSMDDHNTHGTDRSISDETQASASQILRGSDVFQSPTIHRPSSATGQRKEGQKEGTSSPGRKLKHEGRPHQPRHAMTTDGIDIPHAEAGDPGSTPSLQSILKAGAYPLQRAAGFAGYLNRNTKRWPTMLATESMGYVEKVSGMWKGGKKHYDEPRDGSGPDDDTMDEDDAAQVEGSQERFREHFALPHTEVLQAAYFGYLHRVLPLYGKVYISNRSFCFRSLLPGTRTKLIVPLKDIENVEKEKGFRFGYSGLVIVIRGHEELFFEFGQHDLRDDCCITLLQNLETITWLQDSGQLALEDSAMAESAAGEHKALQEARQDGFADHEVNMPKSATTADHEAPPILFDDPRASILNFKPTESLRITCLTIGSRGDVQPYIALCKGLMKDGHRVKIATHAEFKDWVESHGIRFAPVEGDPAELMRICVENGMFTYSFLKEASSTFRGWIDQLLSSAWNACQDSDILIESPSAMAGIHIAEALAIPYYRAFTMPWTRTRAYPHAFAVPERKLGGAYNYMSYVMFENVFWKAIAGQVNRWRKKELGLGRTNLEKMQPNKVPFLYNFSPSVVVPPLDYSDWIRVTGYWFLDEGKIFHSPEELTDFIKKARVDGKKLVYIGFGSIVVSDSAALTKTIIDSVLKADVRCILNKGWSDRLDKKSASEPEIPLPDDIISIKSAPHDWLFKQIDAATHHGGAGTTGASLRAGVPTIIKPFFGDQYFFGGRVEDLGVGIYLRKLNVSVFARALWEATHNTRMINKARVLGEQIRKEDGVDTAIQSIYRDLEYAKSLIKNRTDTDDQEGAEESWTFIGDDGDPELISRIEAWAPMASIPDRDNENKDKKGKGKGRGDRTLGGVPDSTAV